MKKLLVPIGFYLAIMLSSTSCDKRPEGVLTDAQMCDVLADMHKSDAYLKIEKSPADTDSLNRQFMQGILRRHGITRAQFDSSLVWYGHHVDRFDAVYDRVLAQLNEEAGRRPDTPAKSSSGEDLWTGPSTVMLRPWSNRDHLSWAIDSSKVSKGQRLIWEFRAKAPTDAVMTYIGVDYADGTSAWVSSRQYTGDKIQVRLQLDTTLIPLRAYGYARYPSGISAPVVFDSISLQVENLSPDAYYEVYNQHHFSPRKKSTGNDTPTSQD